MGLYRDPQLVARRPGITAALLADGGRRHRKFDAKLLDRVIKHTVAWHDIPAQSAPGSLLCSLAAMLAHRLPGYKEKLEAKGVPGGAVHDPVELFKARSSRRRS